MTTTTTPSTTPVGSVDPVGADLATILRSLTLSRLKDTPPERKITTTQSH